MILSLIKPAKTPASQVDISGSGVSHPTSYFFISSVNHFALIFENTYLLTERIHTLSSISDPLGSFTQSSPSITFLLMFSSSHI